MSDHFVIVDAHQHFWDPGSNYYPWLCDEPPIKFRYGDYRALRRAYLPRDYLADAAPRKVAGTVYVETEWDPRDPLGEMAYVETLRHDSGLPTVAIGQAWLDRDDCEAVLAGLATFPFVRGVRHKPRANAAPRGGPGGMTDPAWRAGYARLADHGLHFELQTPWWHLQEAAALARDFPQTQIVLNHTGLPADRSAEGLAGWRSAMRELAQCPNVAVKISGLGQPGLPWTVASNRAIVLETLDAFGCERAMFASNFPVDSLVASFDMIYAGFETIVAGFSPMEQRALFRDNAIRIYRMELQ